MFRPVYEWVRDFCWRVSGGEARFQQDVITRLHENRTSLMKLNCKHLREISALHKECEGLKDKNTDLREDWKYLRNKHAELFRQNSHLHKEHDKLRGEYSHLFIKNSEMELQESKIESFWLGQMDDLLNNPEEALQCSITQDVPQESMALCTCLVPHAFELSALKRWLQTKQSCPCNPSNKNLKDVKVFPAKFCGKLNEIRKKLVKLEQLEKTKRSNRDKRRQMRAVAKTLLALSKMPPKKTH